MSLRIFLLIGLSLFAAACTGKKMEDLRSPCVGAQESPCDRRSVNDWWLS